MKSYSEYQFSFFRIVMGVYLAVHFSHLLPYSKEIFSREGVLADPSLNFFAGIFPNALLLCDSPTGVSYWLIILIILSILYVLGFQRRLVALILWYGWACLFNRNNLISNPSLPYIGWLLLASSIIPSGERLSLDRIFLSKNKDQSWQMPTIVFYSAWVLLSLGYTISGMAKLKSPSWANGMAIIYLFENPLARDYFLRDWALSLPIIVLKIMTWLSLGLELLFVPFSLSSKLRPWIWAAIIGMHLGILTMVNFADLTLGMLMIHLFTFDARWFPPKPRSEKFPIVFFDGVCGLCNRAINFFIREDKMSVLRFSPLQSHLGETFAGGELRTIIYVDEAGKHTESNAVLAILSRIGGFWRVTAWMAYIVPRPVRDCIYRWIATNRYRFFGRKEVCRIPSSEEKALFLE